MQAPQSLSRTGKPDRQKTIFRLIDPTDYAIHGIDPQDVPMGTFAAEDHPSFLPSRFGGNAYGLGLVEQGALSRADTEFLEGLDFQSPQTLGLQARKINQIFQKLGLLIRISTTGKRYFLIPVNLVAQSLEEIKSKADEIAKAIIPYLFETRTERLAIGLLTGSHDLMVHELTARFSSHRIFLLDSLEKVISWRIPLDIVILPKDPFAYLMDQQLPKRAARSISSRRFFNYALFLAGKIHDILRPNGRILLLSHYFDPLADRICKVLFKSEEEFKLFLLFSHIFKTKIPYKSAPEGTQIDVYASDLHFYLNRFAFYETHTRQLLGHLAPDQLSLSEIDALPHLDQTMQRPLLKDPEKRWKRLFGPYFKVKVLRRRFPEQREYHWQDRMEIDQQFPESLVVFVGEPRVPPFSLSDLEEDLQASGMQGCTLPLVAEHRNSLQYVLEVLKIVAQIRDHQFPRLSELEQARLSNPFLSENASLGAVEELLDQTSRLERMLHFLNPDQMEGEVAPVLENVSKLALHGYSRSQLLEMLLIVVGHTTMSRIVFGKVPAKTLRPITEKAKAGPQYRILEMLRFCRLMSMAEIIVAFGESFSPDHAAELFRLYTDAIAVATDPWLDWERLIDLRISSLGGVQNMAIREMLKFFNFFEFLDHWQELIHKGDFQREVACDYRPEKLRQLEAVMELCRLADLFKRRFLGDYVFGQSYFFRQFLETEFHGTGHLFPPLGTKAGFVLLWIAVYAAERHIVNLNPILAGIPPERHEARIGKLREALLRIPLDWLSPGFFEEVKNNLARGSPAFVYDTGIRIVNNPHTHATEISFVDVGEHLETLERLLVDLDSQKFSTIPLRNLNELERCFSELESFHRYFDSKGFDIDRNLGAPWADASEIQKIGIRIGDIKERLKNFLIRQLFVADEIHDTLSSLSKYCPEILRFALPSFHALGDTIEEYPANPRQSLGVYVMRCLRKLQALVTKDRNAFQDRTTYYQLAKQEFGALAEEGVGASHSQMDILEYLVETLRHRPSLLDALTIALLFQETGKLESLSETLGEEETFRPHAEVGAMALERSQILESIGMDPQQKATVVHLIRYHGLMGRVMQGEEPVTALENLTEKQDEVLFDAAVLQAVLSAAAVREGLMVSDLLDGFLHYRSVGHEIMRSKSSWRAWLREMLQEKGEAVIPDFRLLTGQDAAWAGPFAGGSRRELEAVSEELFQGRMIGAFERLLKLIGSPRVDFQDLQMLLRDIPATFIYHKKKLKSVGLATFEQELRQAAQVHALVIGLPPDVREFLFNCLDHLGRGLRIYGFNFLPAFLDLEECLKLLLVSLQVHQRRFPRSEKSGLILFGPLTQLVGRIQKSLKRDLANVPFSSGAAGGDGYLPQGDSIGGLRFRLSRTEPALRVEYQPAVDMDYMVRTLENSWNQQALESRYQLLVQELKDKLPEESAPFEEILRQVFEKQQKSINDRILKDFQARLAEIEHFRELATLRKDIENQQALLGFTEEQKFLLKEMLEFHRSRVRDIYLESIVGKINRINSREALIGFWHSLKHELLSNRESLGKEYESIVAQLMDERFKEIRD